MLVRLVVSLIVLGCCAGKLVPESGVYDSGVRSGICIGGGCGQDLRRIQLMLVRLVQRYRRTKVTRAADMAEPKGTGVMLDQMLQALLEGRLMQSYMRSARDRSRRSSRSARGMTKR